MSENLIINFSQISQNSHELYAQIRDIYFMTSSKIEFKDQKEKDEFEWKYLGYYFNRNPELCWLSVHNNIVLGYVVGALETQREELYQLQPHLKYFEQEFMMYPAHLHINCRPEAQGMGIGSNLLRTLISQLVDLKIKGVHIMTSPSSKNRIFYHRLGFDREVEQSGILFMGRSLVST